MLPQQLKLLLSTYSDLYDFIVPKDNLLQKINELVDFSFRYDELVNKYRSNNGRNAESPIRMFKYLLLKTIYDVSDVDVVERSCFDMSFISRPDRKKLFRNEELFLHYNGSSQPLKHHCFHIRYLDFHIDVKKRMFALNHESNILPA